MFTSYARYPEAAQLEIDQRLRTVAGQRRHPVSLRTRRWFGRRPRGLL
jgi:hypothetical protein